MYIAGAPAVPEARHNNIMSRLKSKPQVEQKSINTNKYQTPPKQLRNLYDYNMELTLMGIFLWPHTQKMNNYYTYGYVPHNLRLAFRQKTTLLSVYLTSNKTPTQKEEGGALWGTARYSHAGQLDTNLPTHAGFMPHNILHVDLSV